MPANVEPSYGDPITAPFWEGAVSRRLLIQRCKACGKYQFYPRPFCIPCGSDDIEWVQASGKGTVYSMTVVRIQISPDFTPPYTVAVVQLDEGPRMLSNIVGSPVRIGDAVKVIWRNRADAPPLPVFEALGEEKEDPDGKA
jgi:uncharacterized OB-fold protein